MVIHEANLGVGALPCLCSCFMCRKGGSGGSHACRQPCSERRVRHSYSSALAQLCRGSSTRGRVSSAPEATQRGGRAGADDSRGTIGRDGGLDAWRRYLRDGRVNPRDSRTPIRASLILAFPRSTTLTVVFAGVDWTTPTTHEYSLQIPLWLDASAAESSEPDGTVELTLVYSVGDPAALAAVASFCDVAAPLIDGREPSVEDLEVIAVQAAATLPNSVTSTLAAELGDLMESIRSFEADPTTGVSTLAVARGIADICHVDIRAVSSTPQ